MIEKTISTWLSQLARLGVNTSRQRGACAATFGHPCWCASLGSVGDAFDELRLSGAAGWQLEAMVARVLLGVTAALRAVLIPGRPNC